VLEWLDTFGPERVILGADSKDRLIASNGWLSASRLDVVDFVVSYALEGIRSVIATDIASDGMLQGPAVALYRELIEKTKVGVIASGGVSSIDDLVELRAIGCEGAIVGKAIYEGNITLEQLAALC
jgi:phosphoribosylformimino-5-aminoimidazole carboxamide ribotide isomerase